MVPLGAAALPPYQQRAALKRLLAIAISCTSTEPDRAHGLAEDILATVRVDRLPARAPLLRRQLAGRALLACAAALITLRAPADALPLIDEAHAIFIFPRTIAYARDRIHAQLLRGKVLAATDRVAEALGTLIAAARRAVEHIDPLLLVDALTSLAVVLCAHAEYDIARPALDLAARIAAQPGNEATLTVLHNGLTECAFLGYERRQAS